MDKNPLNLKAKKAFYFMPDISGFSGFVQNTPVEHSIHIISELLEILLDNNVLEMELAEVEGDALFMYSVKAFQIEDLEQQVTRMLNAFYRHLQRYNQQRICSCGACSTAINLRLKFLVHYGRLDFIQVREIKKPYGQDVNRIHRLLKNDVPIEEYLLFSHQAFKALHLDLIPHDLLMMESNYDINILPYYYGKLEKYKKDLADEKPSGSKIGIDTKADFIVEKDIAAPINVIYELISNFKYRKSWDKSLTRIQFDVAKVNRVSTKHNCIIGNRKIAFETSGHLHFKADEVYAEKTSDIPMTSSYHYYILLDSLNDKQTRVKVLNFVEMDWLGRIFKNKVSNRIKNNWKKKLKNLEIISQEYNITEI